MKTLDIKPQTKQDKLLDKFLNSKIPDRKYQDMDKTVYQTKGTHDLLPDEKERWD